MAWFTLKSVPGIGDLLFKRLLDHFRSPESVLQAAHRKLLEVNGVTPRLATAIKKHKMPDRTKLDYERVIQKGFEPF